MSTEEPQVVFEKGQLWKNLVTLDTATVSKVISKQVALANAGTRSYVIKVMYIGTHWKQIS